MDKTRKIVYYKHCQEGKAPTNTGQEEPKMKYNRQSIMRRAHEIRKTSAPKPTMGDALRAAWAEAKKDEPKTNALDITAQNLFKVRAMLARLAAEEAALEETIKAAIEASGNDNISGFGWKASWKDVESRRFDSKTFKAQHGDLYAQFQKPQTCKRFLFGAV